MEKKVIKFKEKDLPEGVKIKDIRRVNYVRTILENKEMEIEIEVKNE